MAVWKQFSGAAAIIGGLALAGCSSRPLLTDELRDDAVGSVYQDIAGRDSPESAINQMFPLKDESGRSQGVLFVSNFDYEYGEDQYNNQETRGCLNYRIWNGGGNGGDVIEGKKCNPMQPKRASAKMKEALAPKQ